MSKSDYRPVYVTESGNKYWSYKPRKTIKNITYPIADRFDFHFMFSSDVRGNVGALTSGGIDISTLLFVEDHSQC